MCQALQSTEDAPMGKGTGCCLFGASGPVSRGQIKGCLVCLWERQRSEGMKSVLEGRLPVWGLIPVILLPSYDPSLHISLVFSNMGMKTGFISFAGNLKHAKWTYRALVGKVLRISRWHSRALTTHGPFCVPRRAPWEWIHGSHTRPEAGPDGDKKSAFLNGC